MKPQWWAVRWGDVTRLTWDKHDCVEGACHDCYGMVATSMVAKPLGAVKRKIQTNKWFQEQLASAEGWVSPPRTIYNYKPRRVS